MLAHLASAAAATAAAIAAFIWMRRRTVRVTEALGQRARFARALDHARDAMLIVDLQGRILDVNLEAEKLSGYDRTRLIGRHLVTDLCLDAEQPAAWQALHAVVRTGENLCESVHLTAAGRQVPVEVSGRVALLSNERVVVCVVRDISERREAARREKRLQQILRTTSAINQLIVRESDRQRLLERACQILVEFGGYPLAWIGIREGDALVPVAWAGASASYAPGISVRTDDSPRGRGPGGEALRRGATVVMTVDDPAFAPWRERALTVGLAVCAATPLRTAARARGVMLLYAAEAGAFSPDLIELLDELGSDLGFALDTLEQRAALAAAQEHLARNAAALRQVAEGAILTDEAGIIVDVNPAFERLSGYGRDEVMGRRPNILKSGLQSPGFYQAMWQQLVRDDVWTGELTNRRKDGSLYTAEVTISAVRGADGAVMNYVGLQRDVSRERELTEHLRRVQRVQELGQLSAGLAHDFNNLLTVVLSNLSLIDGELPPEAAAVRPYLADIGGAARLGSDLVRKLLAVGRQRKLSMDQLDVRRLLDDSSRMLSRVIPENVEVRCVISGGDLPAIRADAGAVGQILLNLASNARDAMPEGGELTLSAAVVAIEPEEARREDTEPGDYVRIGVADTGTGMDAATASRVFEPFFTTKPVGKGTGLGLAMVFGLVRQHRGFVRVATEPGRGTAMQLYFPAVAAAMPEPAPAPPAVRPGAGTETLLLVEDEPALRRAAVRCLSRLGYQVIEAGNGEEGWETFQRHEADIQLVISDAVMPRLSGPALFARIRAAGSDVPLLLNSGYADSVVDDLPAGEVVPVLPKPWTAADLGAMVRELLDRAAVTSGSG